MSILPGGWATQIKCAGDLLLCTSFNFPENTVQISSGGAYGGTIDGALDMAIGSPYVLDYSGVNGSLSYEPSEDQAVRLIRWLGERNNYKEITANTPGGTATYTYCFFTNIGFQADEGALLSANVDVWTMRNALTTDTVGSGTLPMRATALEVPTVVPVPYWNTQITPFTPVSSSLLSWNLSASQDFVKKFFCDASAATTAPEPDYVLVGPMGLELSMSFIMLGSVSLADLLYDFSATPQYIKFGTRTFLTMAKVTSVNAQPNIAEMNGFYTADVTYNIHSITLPPAP